MTDHPQRPTELEAIQRLVFYEGFTTRLTQTLNAPANTLYSYRGKQPSVVMICTALWFDLDEDVEIEAPEDEAPESE